MSMWFLPPYVGQRVALNPQSPHYRRYNDNQAKNSNGIIIESSSSHINNWITIFNESRMERCELYIRWDNGHENSYSLRDVMPVETKDKFYKFTFVGGMNRIMPESEVEQTLDNLLINQGYTLRSKEELGTDKKDKAYKKIANKLYEIVTSTGVISPKNAQIIEALSAHGYGLQHYDLSAPSDATISGLTVDDSGIAPQQAFGAVDMEEFRRQVAQITENIGTPRPRHPEEDGEILFDADTF